MHLADCMDRDTCSQISRHRGVSCPVCTWRAVVTWCVSSCFTEIVQLFLLIVGEQLILFVYLSIALKLFPTSRGTAWTQRQLTQSLCQPGWQQPLKTVICLCMG